MNDEVSNLTEFHSFESATYQLCAGCSWCTQPEGVPFIWIASCHLCRSSSWILQPGAVPYIWIPNLVESESWCPQPDAVPFLWSTNRSPRHGVHRRMQSGSFEAPTAGRVMVSTAGCSPVHLKHQPQAESWCPPPDAVPFIWSTNLAQAESRCPPPEAVPFIWTTNLEQAESWCPQPDPVPFIWLTNLAQAESRCPPPDAVPFIWFTDLAQAESWCPQPEGFPIIWITNLADVRWCLQLEGVLSLSHSYESEFPNFAQAAHEVSKTGSYVQLNHHFGGRPVMKSPTWRSPIH
jgi:hypothetical protein